MSITESNYLEPPDVYKKPGPIWIAGYNKPGYLPYKQAEEFDSPDEAWAYLSEEVQHDIDTYELEGEALTKAWEIQGLMESYASDGEIEYNGYVYWVTKDSL